MTTNIGLGQVFTNSRTFTTNSCLDSISKIRTELVVVEGEEFCGYLNRPSISCILWRECLIIYKSKSMKDAININV